MHEVRLPLGERRVCIPLPAEIDWSTWTPAAAEPGAGLAPPELGPALSRELERTRSGWEQEGKAPDAAIVVPDLTRPAPLGELLDPLLAALERAGVERRRCRLIVATGTHQRPEREALWQRWGRGPELELVIHDGDAPGIPLGETPGGTPVELDPAYVAAALRITVGAVSFHYFAGFGGGPKLVFPGLATRKGVEANHRRALAPLPPGGLAAGCAPGLIDGNPVAGDITAAADLCAAHVGIHLLAVADGWRGWVGDDGLDEARGKLLQWGTQGGAGSHDVVVASAGGAPHDIDLVQSHKALRHASLYCREGGTILLIAATPNGPGSQSFARWLAIAELSELESRAREDYELNAQTAISLRTLNRRFQVLWLGSRTPEWVERAGAIPVAHPAAAWARLPSPSIGSGRRRGAVLPNATAVIPAGTPPGG